jgi:hypothetical protein
VCGARGLEMTSGRRVRSVWVEGGTSRGGYIQRKKKATDHQSCDHHVIIM